MVVPAPICCHFVSPMLFILFWTSTTMLSLHTFVVISWFTPVSSITAKSYCFSLLLNSFSLLPFFNPFGKPYAFWAYILNFFRSSHVTSASLILYIFFFQYLFSSFLSRSPLSSSSFYTFFLSSSVTTFFMSVVSLSASVFISVWQASSYVLSFWPLFLL